jgi:hypothetical protein
MMPTRESAVVGIRTGMALVAALVGLMASAGSVAAGNWSPNSARVLGSSTTIGLLITANGAPNPTLFGCASATFLVTTAMGGSNELTFTPTVTDCDPNTMNFTTAGNWKAVSVGVNVGNKAEARLEIPTGGFKFEPVAGCKIEAEATNTIVTASNYTNGNAFTPPSIWAEPPRGAQPKKVKIIAQTNLGAACYTAQRQTEVPIIFTINLYNLTAGANAGIHVN